MNDDSTRNVKDYKESKNHLGGSISEPMDSPLYKNIDTQIA